MRQWPDYALETVASVVAPTLRRKPAADEIGAVLNLLRRAEAPVGEIATACGLSVSGLKYRLRQAGVKAVGIRGKGHEKLYRWEDLREIVGDIKLEDGQ